MELCILPNELLKLVISYTDIQDAKNFSQTSKRMYQLTLSRIWSKPSFAYFKTPAFLKKISKFPVKRLSTENFSDCSLMLLQKSFPQLELLSVNSRQTFEVKDFGKVRIPLILDTSSIKFSRRTHYFDQIRTVLGSTNVLQLDVNHEVDYMNERRGRLSLEQLKKINSIVPITQLAVDCVDLNENNLVQFIKLLSEDGFKDCQISMTYITNNDRYLFTIQDLELMIEHDIKVTYIMSDALRTDGLSENLGLFAPVLKRMKHLGNFYFTQGPLHEMDGPPPVHLFTDIPMNSISTIEFQMVKGNINNIAHTISQIKSLQGFDIFYFDSNDYKLSPVELSLFKDLPITHIDEDALDLTKENLEEFRQILLTLKDFDCRRLFERMDEI